MSFTGSLLRVYFISSCFIVCFLFYFILFYLFIYFLFSRIDKFDVIDIFSYEVIWQKYIGIILIK